MDPMQVIAVVAAIAAGAGAIASAVVSWRIHRANRAPEVVAFIDRYDTPMLWFVLQNIGNGVAYDIEFDSGDLPSRDEAIKAKFDAFRDFGVPMLMPGQQRRVPVYAATSSAKTDSATYKVIVRYASEHNGSKTVAEYHLDYKSFENTLWTDGNETLIRRSLQSIDHTLKAESSVRRMKRANMPEIFDYREAKGGSQKRSSDYDGRPA